MQIPIHAIYIQLADASRMPEMAFVRCEFGNKHCKTIIAHVLVTDGQVQEMGDFERDGVTFPTAEIRLILSTLWTVMAICSQQVI